LAFPNGLILAMVGIAAGLLTFIVSPIVAKAALAAGVVDHPEPRKQHETPIPLLGGVTVLASVAVCSAVAVGLVLDGTPDPVSRESYRWLIGIGVGVVVLALVGLVDDIRPVPISIRLAAQVVSAGIFVGLLGTADGPIGAMGWAIGLAAWLVLMTNSFNLIDNMDGLAPGVGAVAAVFFALLLRGDIAGLVSAALAGALAGFLVHNRHPARVFLGDGGSLPIGFLLGAIGLWFAVGEGRMSPVVTLVLAVPLLDTALVVISRLRRGLNPLTTPGRDHLSHRLVALGLTVPAAVASLWVAAIGGGLAGLVASRQSSAATWVVAAIAVGVSLVVIVVMERRAPDGLTVTAESTPIVGGSPHE
jgi:UDP-GlcNAc:undecaprenyl-phosphate GlcNAc-1-phosphate transferase